MNKKKVLGVVEFSQTCSGLGLYSYNLLKRLSEVYDVAALECYGTVNDPRDKSVGNWRYYANAAEESHPLYDTYKSSPQNQHGLWRFEYTVLAEMPDVVIDFRDANMMTFEYMTPLRDFYSLVVSPCVDSDPLQQEWLEFALNADSVLSYSDYGEEVLKQEGSGKIKLAGAAYPGVDFENLKPLSQEQVREKYNMPKEWVVVLMNARNQRRKLFLDLIDAFKLYLTRVKDSNPYLYHNTYLYFNTSILDLNPWDLSKAICQSGLGNRIIFSYVCTRCNNLFWGFYQGMRGVCDYCGNIAMTPSVGRGLTREQIGEVYNLADCYVQFATAEASAFSIQESAACGLPFLAVNCTAMQNSLRLLNGIPIKCQRGFWDIDVGAKRYLPDNDDFVEKLIDLLSLPKAIRMRRGYESHLLCKEHFDWDKNAAKWIQAIENAAPAKKNWGDPKEELCPNFNVPQGLNEEEFVYWCIDNIMCRPQFKYSFTAMNSIKNLKQGQISDGGKIKPFTREKFFTFCKNYIENRMYFERIRVGEQIMPDLDFIRYANIKELCK